MPIFEYKCEKCGGVREVLVRTRADQPTACAKCGSKKLRRLFSMPAAVRGSEDSDFDGLCDGCDEACDLDSCEEGVCPRE